MKKDTGAFTLMELLLTMLMVAVLMWAAVYVFQAVLLSWSSQETRAGLDININKGIEMVVIDLRRASSVQSSNDEIRFTADGTTYYIYYLYNSGDSYPPAFNKASYDLKKTTLSGGMNGIFTYGAGNPVILGVLPPPTSDLSFTGNVINIDLSVMSRNETVRSKTEVRPRNI
jgi:hypothetical protein